jgi:hypothetical protein
MTKCQNPECQKEIVEGKKYCNETCLRRHLKLKRPKLASEENLWLGQDRRKRAMETILKLAEELCPMSCHKFACIVSYRTGLSLRKITDEYVEVLLATGLLERKGNILNLGDEIS